jgi:hypothetical protein
MELMKAPFYNIELNAGSFSYSAYKNSASIPLKCSFANSANILQLINSLEIAVLLTVHNDFLSLCHADTIQCQS